ncbi:hypothetical protein HWD96_02485 [Pseudomonas putida]|uniref:hypothetical protein n=2 Tax=Pseudomonas putida TaxID=303 RepID=UPI001F51D960|nr:hypothetical protein [Pseudomonas putida]MCI1021090.1 hypothetical protein [Pseudomonas putida]
MKSEDRIEFSTSVKNIIWNRAGGLCSIRACLKSVFGTDGNLEIGEDPHKSTTVGNAAHIYSARENWARGQGGKPKSFISSAANGISTCRNCHWNVDSVESKYPAEELFEMKAVREQAQDINRHNPAVSFYVSKVGTEHLDELVWDAENRKDEKSISDKFIIYAESAVQALRGIKLQLGHIMPPPQGCNQLPISKAISSSNNPKTDDYGLLAGTWSRTSGGQSETKSKSEIAQSERTLSLAKSWSGNVSDTFFFDRVRCQFFTRDKLTREEGIPAKFHVTAGPMWGSLKDDCEAIINVIKFDSAGAGFRWRMKAERYKKKHVQSCELRLARITCPDSTDDTHFLNDFLEYSRLLKEIAAGREPCIRLSKFTSVSKDEWGDDIDLDDMHPLEFTPKLIDGPEWIRKVIESNNKVLTAFRLSREMQVPITFRNKSISEDIPADLDNPCMLGLFDERLTEELMRVGISEAIHALHYNMSPAVSSPLVNFVEEGVRYTIKASCNGFRVGFFRCLA